MIEDMSGSEDDFFEEDETLDEIRAAIRRSRHGVTVGSNRLPPPELKQVWAAHERLTGSLHPMAISAGFVLNAGAHVHVERVRSTRVVQIG
jgi:hypothetical protein